MRLLLSNLPWWQRGDNGEIRAGIRAGSRWPFTFQTNSRPDAPAYGEYLPYCMFLGFAASWCQRAFPHAKVILRDSLARRESYGVYLEHLAAEQYDYIVIESATPCWSHDRHCLRLIREASPRAKIIITGTITSTRAQEITDLGHAAVLGEYEKGVVRALKGEWGKIPHDMLTTEEMNAAPFPMFDEEYALTYFDACPSGQTSPELIVWTTRGCTFSCVFCSWPATMTNNDPDGQGKRRVRFYSPEYVDAQIRARLERNPTIKSIRLDDDTMNFGDKHTMGISAVMKRIGLPWSAMCRADTIKLSTWNIMHEAGCFGVKLGMESGSQHVVTNIVNKHLDLTDVESRILPHLKSIGMHIHTTWTVGLPGETPTQAGETIAMIQRLYDKGLHHTHQLSGTATIEGTPLHKIAQGEKLKAYPGASNEDFAVNPDGQDKIERMSRALPVGSQADK
jgi:radical SAM superfamily enzyme YgiQ (UPF0313 family)